MSPQTRLTRKRPKSLKARLKPKYRAGSAAAPQFDESLMANVWRRLCWGADWFLYIARSVMLCVHWLLHWGLLAAGHAWQLLRHYRRDRTTAAEHRLRRRWTAIDRFNRDTARLLEIARDKLSESRGYLVPDDEAGGLSECVRGLRETYALADTAAICYQTWHWWMVAALFAIAFAAVACLEVFAHLWHRSLVLWGYLLLLGLGYLVFHFTRRLEHQGRWLDYRALAEALRVQVFWRLAGRNDCVADHYLRHFRGELDWIRHAARAAFLTAGGHVLHDAPVAAEALYDPLQDVRRFWVADQRAFFTGKAPYHDEVEIAFGMAARLAFLAAVLFASVTVVRHDDGAHTVEHGLVLATFAFLLAVAFLEKFSDIHAHSLLARRYRWMTDLYRNADERLAAHLGKPDFSGDDMEHVQQLLFELGKEALSENADWVVQHRQRPPVFPSG